MKNDPNEHAKQLSLNFDSCPAKCGSDMLKPRPAGLTLAYSTHQSAIGRKEVSERELIISETLSFARKLSW
jgi:hypothetical protein